MVNNFQAKLQLRNFLLWHPELEADEEAKTISIESETQFLEVVEESLDRIGTLEAWIEGLEKRGDTVKKRLEREKKQLLEILLITGHRGTQSARGTASIGYAPKKVILDKTSYPEEFMRHTPNKEAIKRHLLDGGELEGAVLSDNREPFLITRTK